MNKYMLIIGVGVLMLGSVGALLVFGRMAPPSEVSDAVVVTTRDATQLMKADVTYFEGATGYFVRPAAPGVYPGVVMIHENRGLRPEIRTEAEELAKEGYMVLAVDLFKGRVMETQEEARAYSQEFNQAEGVENLKAAAAFLREKGATKLASLGWCFGGAQSLNLALADTNLDATVIYYGRLATTTTALSPLKQPVLGIFGEVDQVVSTSSVAQFQIALDQLSVPNEIYTYSNVGHAFANPSNPNHAPLETDDAWGKTLSFLQKHLR